APQKGIMGIHLKVRGTVVIQKKGKPDAERVVANEILGQQRILRYGKTRVGLAGPKRSDRVVAVTTKDPRQRTRSGVGVGSREKAVKNRIESPASAEYLPYAARRDTRRWGRGAEHR